MEALALGAVFRQEGLRKAFHSLSAGYALLYFVAGRRHTATILGVLVAVAAAVEAARLRNPDLNEKLLGFFGGIHREKEVQGASGIFWTLAGCFGVALLIPFPDIALASMLFLTVGDGLAGFVGRNWGRLRLGRKSLEGSLACFLGTWVVAVLVLSPNFGRPEALYAALAVTALEALDLPPDDNFTLPLISGLGLWAARVWW